MQMDRLTANAPISTPLATNQRDDGHKYQHMNVEPLFTERRLNTPNATHPGINGMVSAMRSAT